MLDQRAVKDELRMHHELAVSFVAWSTCNQQCTSFVAVRYSKVCKVATESIQSVKHSGSVVDSIDQELATNHSSVQQPACSPDFATLHMPTEPCLQRAGQHLPSVQDCAVRKRKRSSTPHKTRPNTREQFSKLSPQAVPSFNLNEAESK